MKIFIIPVNSEFQPEKTKFIYPKGNNYIGAERVFYNWLIKHKELITKNVEEADYHYLPIFWSNYFLNNGFGKTGMEELQAECQSRLIDPERTFTLCQYDDGPRVNLRNTIVFEGSRKKTDGLDIPLLCSEHKYVERRKKYIASFVGRVETHPIRRELKSALKHHKNFLFIRGHWRLGEKIFVWSIEKSYACLCPRGYGGGSFRFYEAMQMGVVPVHIGNIDIRPFKNQIDWDKFSFCFTDPYEAIQCLEGCSKEKLSQMGKDARRFYKEYFSTDNWCKFLIEELKDIKR